MPCTKSLPGSSCPKERLLTSLPLQAPPPASQKGGLPTSAAGRYICNGLQGWPWLRLIPDVDSPGMCLLSNCPASEGSHPPPLHPPLPLLHPSESVQHVEAFLLSHSLCRNSHSRDQGQPGGGPHSPPAWSMGLGSGRSQPIPPSFFWGQSLGGRGRNSGKLTIGERIWLQSAVSPNPWPFLGMPLTFSAPLMERTGLLSARPAP